MFSRLLVQHLRSRPGRRRARRGRRPCRRRTPRGRRAPRRAAWMLAATISWLAALTVCPAPLGPTCTIVLPTASRTGAAAAKSAASPPTMIDRAAFSAPASPPETGASSSRKPRLRACVGEVGGDVGPDAGEVDDERARAGGVEDPALAGQQHVRTSGESGTITATTSASATASAIEPAARPPAVDQRLGCGRGAVVADDVEPGLLARWTAIGLPMMPRPMNAMLVMLCSCSRCSLSLGGCRRSGR